MILIQTHDNYLVYSVYDDNSMGSDIDYSIILELFR